MSRRSPTVYEGRVGAAVDFDDDLCMTVIKTGISLENSLNAMAAE